MKTFVLDVRCKLQEYVEVEADTYEEAIVKYCDGDYDKCEELDREVISVKEME
jgi:hypothetical protein